MPKWASNFIGAALLVLLGLIGSPFLLALALIVAAGYVRVQLLRWVALRRFRGRWLSRGRDLLIVYSDSPHWQTYVQERWLPKWGHRAVVLNWSERRRWLSSRTPEAAMFRAFAGFREFNPIAIVVPGRGAAQVVRFWRAFKDFKHGKTELLLQKEEELERALAAGGTRTRGRLRRSEGI